MFLVINSILYVTSPHYFWIKNAVIRYMHSVLQFDTDKPTCLRACKYFCGPEELHTAHQYQDLKVGSLLKV